jgi:ADP-L-glycero-D-manno-heptose 6-epimerase
MIILTGGAGFIGSAFLHRLNQAGVKDVVVVDNLRSSPKWKNLSGKIFHEYLPSGELLQELSRGRWGTSIDAIVHLGACSATTEENVDYLFENNTRFSTHLAEHCLQHQIRFLYASSGATYGNGDAGYDDTRVDFERLHPLNPYGFSKLLFDSWVVREQRQQKLCGLRFFNVYGPNEYHKGEMQSVVRKAHRQARELGEIRLFRSHRDDYRHGEQKRDFVYIKDVVEVMWWLLQNPSVNGIYNVGSGKARSWNDLARSVFNALRLTPQIEYIDMPERLRGQYQYFTEAPMQKLASVGCPVPTTSLEAGIEDYVTQYLDRNEAFL